MYVFDTKRLLLKFSKIMRYYTYDIFKSFSVKDIGNNKMTGILQ